MPKLDWYRDMVELSQGLATAVWLSDWEMVLRGAMKLANIARDRVAEQEARRQDELQLRLEGVH